MGIDEKKDCCCICNKILFINGKRQTDLCYEIGIMRKRILNDGQYSDGFDCCAYICKSCFSRHNNELIMKALWKGHELFKKNKKSKR